MASTRLPHPSDAAREMETVLRALHFAGQLAGGLDRAQGALHLDDPVRYSALRTLVEHAQNSAERIQALLRQLGMDPPPAGQDPVDPSPLPPEAS